MFERVMVPLDGSDFAEAALPPARALCRLSGGELLFVRVVRTIDELMNTPIDFNVDRAEFSQDVLAGRAHEDEQSEAARYLEATRHAAELEGIRADVAIREGVPADEILAEAVAQKADLIVLTAYGLGGAHSRLEKNVFGGVADSVLRASRIPVLVIRP